ncbi:MAG: hypothetical protein K6C05_05485 [Anaerovibrio sp.]|nr:hypothetical protein [Anaerovibrio sp.]MCR5176285.1 hypothetical protein [Anaerovibrio sp.]
MKSQIEVAPREWYILALDDSIVIGGFFIAHIGQAAEMRQMDLPENILL